MRVLVIEDDPRMAGLLHRGLARQGWATTTVSNATAAQDAALAAHWDAVVCDVMLPDMSGVELCRWLRRNDVWAPVLLLTARTAVGDRVAGLDAGADDYMGKPFAFAELEARLRALVRRGPVERPTTVVAGPLQLDPAAHEATVNGTPLELSPKEFALLHLFLRHPGEVLSRSTILDHVWDYAYDGGSNVVDVYVRYLRRKLASQGADRMLVTVRGAGYRLVVEK
ncbi:MAG: two-component system, OmpR family, response regulator [Frankiaceae bacterium]|jgi:two-component system OmpR family response regulator|nr:two-component system, OmpR family, response regulator [Frankiaceae bacterium]